MVKVCGAPAQPNADGVTVIVAVMGALVILIAVKDAISPLPFAAKPIDGLLFVQLKAVLLTVPLKLIAVVVAPLHNS
jgi:hypothetical protein